MKKLETYEEDIACIRACLERLLMAKHPIEYKDYQLEKWGRIVGSDATKKLTQFEHMILDELDNELVKDRERCRWMELFEMEPNELWEYTGGTTITAVQRFKIDGGETK